MVFLRTLVEIDNCCQGKVAAARERLLAARLQLLSSIVFGWWGASRVQHILWGRRILSVKSHRVSWVWEISQRDKVGQVSHFFCHTPHSANYGCSSTCWAPRARWQAQLDRNLLLHFLHRAIQLLRILAFTRTSPAHSCVTFIFRVQLCILPPFASVKNKTGKWNYIIMRVWTLSWHVWTQGRGGSVHHWRCMIFHVVQESMNKYTQMPA